MNTYFQRRHYIAIAEILSTANAEAGRIGDLFAVGLLETLTERFAEFFKADNPRFVVSRFLDAAKGGTSK